jgi:hypothetical protein
VREAARLVSLPQPEDLSLDALDELFRFLAVAGMHRISEHHSDGRTAGFRPTGASRLGLVGAHQRHGKERDLAGRGKCCRSWLEIAEFPVA